MKGVCVYMSDTTFQPKGYANKLWKQSGSDTQAP